MREDHVPHWGRGRCLCIAGLCVYMRPCPTTLRTDRYMKGLFRIFSGHTRTHGDSTTEGVILLRINIILYVYVSGTGYVREET